MAHMGNRYFYTLGQLFLIQDARDLFAPLHMIDSGLQMHLYVIIHITGIVRNYQYMRTRNLLGNIEQIIPIEAVLSVGGNPDEAVSLRMRENQQLQRRKKANCPYDYEKENFPTHQRTPSYAAFLN
jgi:hypothetical protein